MQPDLIPAGIKNIIVAGDSAKSISGDLYIAASVPYVVPGCIIPNVAARRGRDMAAVFQHNQPAAVAVAPIVSRLSVADIVPAGLLAVFLANPLRVSVAA